MMNEVFRGERRVEFRDTDAATMLHFTSYFAYMESVEHEFWRHLGLSVLMEDEQGKLSWPRVSATCDYTGVVRFEDMLEIELSIQRLGGKSVTFRYDFLLDGTSVAVGKVTVVCCRMESSGVKSRPVSCPIPESIAAKLRPYVQEPAP